MEQNRIADYRAYFDRLDATEDTAVAGAPTGYKSWHNSKTLATPKMVKYIAECYVGVSGVGSYSYRYPTIVFRAPQNATDDQLSDAFLAEFNRQFPLRWNDTHKCWDNSCPDNPAATIVLKDYDFERVAEKPTTAQRIAYYDRKLRQYYGGTKRVPLSPYKG